jgi:hypothetical protein
MEEKLKLDTVSHTHTLSTRNLSTWHNDNKTLLRVKSLTKITSSSVNYQRQNQFLYSWLYASSGR